MMKNKPTYLHTFLCRYVGRKSYIHKTYIGYNALNINALTRQYVGMYVFCNKKDKKNTSRSPLS